MDNIRLEGNEYKSITYTRGEALGGNFRERRFDHDRNILRRFLNLYA